MKVIKNLAVMLGLAIACLVTVHTASAEELAPANPDHTTKWETAPITGNLLKKSSSEPTIADISYYQKDIDWSKASTALDLVIIRTQYGSTFEDPKHTSYEAGAKKYGVPFGVYSYSLAESSSDAKVEANNFYNRASKDAKFYVLDVEQNTSKSGESMRTIINAYVNQLRTKTDKKIGLYIANHLYDEFNLDTSKFDFVWIPRYNNSTAAPSHPYDLWQYTDQGRVAGISTYVDLNRLNPNVNLSYLTGKSDITTASNPRYYTTNPGKIATKVQLNQYSSTSFTDAKKGKVIPKNTIIDVAGIVKTSAGTPRLKLANGTYLTANRDYVVKVASNIDQYYTKTPSKILVKS
ncbi:MAG TPA: GH25 family lysozyme, partial [Rummeliibacillus sp.]|nr:GH25 family lysozyme [Rummeliibacillus sp.]